MSGGYLVPAGVGEAEFTEKRSRFLGHVFPVESEEEARACIEQKKKQHYDARHNCWCFRLKGSGAERYSDDGEPQGTAGQPMLNVFQREGIWNVCCVVTRYFGGILLGAGGLVRAYTQSAKDALDAAGIARMCRWTALEVPCSYAQFEGVRRELSRFGGIEEHVDYGADVLLSVLVPAEHAGKFAAHLLDTFAGTVEALEAGEVFRAGKLQIPEGRGSS